MEICEIILDLLEDVWVFVNFCIFLVICVFLEELCKNIILDVRYLDFVKDKVEFLFIKGDLLKLFFWGLLGKFFLKILMSELVIGLVGVVGCIIVLLIFLIFLFEEVCNWICFFFRVIFGKWLIKFFFLLNLFEEIFVVENEIRNLLV